MNDQTPTFESLDKMLRAGQGADVRKALSQLDRSKLSRESLADWANLARRSGMVTLSLRFLQPILRLKQNLGEAASPKERASYAASLGAIGALAEAYKILSGLEDSPVPEVQLFYGFTHVYSWNYGAAAEFFKRYAEMDTPSKFQKAVARINLAASQSFLKNFDEVLALSDELVRETSENGWVVLQSEAHLLHAQALLNTGVLDQAQASINSARELSASKNLNLLHVEKWQRLLNLRMKGPTDQVLEDLGRLKAEAKEARVWEIIRDCDYHVGLHNEDRRLIDRAYFGTPFSAYRERIKNEAAGWFNPRTIFNWNLHETNGPVLDLTKGKLEVLAQNESQLFMRVLRALSSDFYRPLKMGCLFNEIYPGEYYDAESSPVRVKTALSRTRAILKKSGLPLRILCLKQDYYLASDSPFNLKVKIEYPPASSEPEIPIDFLRSLKNRWPHKSFSSQQAAELLGLPSNRTREMLKLAADRNRVYKSGEGRSRVYRFRK